MITQICAWTVLVMIGVVLLLILVKIFSDHWEDVLVVSIICAVGYLMIRLVAWALDVVLK